jgi:hypothetical protein
VRRQRAARRVRRRAARSGGGCGSQRERWSGRVGRLVGFAQGLRVIVRLGFEGLEQLESRRVIELQQRGARPHVHVGRCAAGWSWEGRALGSVAAAIGRSLALESTQQLRVLLGKHLLKRIRWHVFLEQLVQRPPPKGARLGRLLLRQVGDQRL